MIPSKYSFNVHIILGILFGLCYVEGQSRCLTPQGKSGTCIPIKNCDFLVQILLKKNKSQEDIQLLRNSQCGFENNAPMVCCAIPEDPSDRRCFTPDGQVGVCTGLHSCDSLTRLLQPPVSKENILYLLFSKCEGPEQYSVCCGSQATGDPPQPTTSCPSTVAPPDPRSECCGVDDSSHNLIASDNVTAIDQYPWLTVIEYRLLKDNKTRLMCGGVLISGKYVLTAAHCVTGPILSFGTPIRVRAGVYNTKNPGVECIEIDGGGIDCTLGEVSAPIEDTIPHKDYSPTFRLSRHDIALIRLQIVVPFSNFIRPICLPSVDITQTTNSQIFDTAGWGAASEFQSSDVKLKGYLPFVPQKECQPYYNVSQRKVSLWEGQLCAGGEIGKNSCIGDSGGPLMMYNGRLYEVVGIVSFGPTPCGIADEPGVYTKVYAYLPWIRTHMKP